MTAANTRVYEGGRLAAEGFPVTDVSEWLGRGACTVWVDFCGPTEADLAEVAQELGLHELAVEDAVGRVQRPKLDRYESHLFLSCRAVDVDVARGELDAPEVSAFIGPDWLVTVRKDDRFTMDQVVARWDRSPDLATHGVSFLVYGLLDVVVDGYFDAVNRFDEFYDDISEGLFSDTPLDPADQRHWFEMRRALVAFHRLAVPMREAVSSLMRREHTVVVEALYPYYQDVYDHILRVSESTDALRDLVATIVETNLSLRDFRQNQVMKKVTSWAAIIAVPTLITGWYGMNVPYPGFARHSGLHVATALTILASGLLYLTFKRRDWL